MRHRFAHTVVRLRAQRVDDGYNGTRPDWTSTSDLKIRRCLVVPGRSEEMRDQGREGVEVRWTVYVDGRCDVQAGDRLRIPFDPEPLAVEGDPRYWENLGGRSGTVIELVDVRG